MADKTAVPEQDRFMVNGEFESEAKAQAVQAKLDEARLIAAMPDQSDILPPGFDYGSIRDRTLKFRDSLLELPMNETHLPDGSTNPMYDRAWFYAWGSSADTMDIPDKQTKGYRLVSREDLEGLVKEGRCPDFYLNMVREEGSYLVYGDLIMMRMPRVLRRQLQAEKLQAARMSIARTERDIKDRADDLGIPEAKAPIKNELTINF